MRRMDHHRLALTWWCRYIIAKYCNECTFIPHWIDFALHRILSWHTFCKATSYFYANFRKCSQTIIKWFNAYI